MQHLLWRALQQQALDGCNAAGKGLVKPSHLIDWGLLMT
jgi:hypothetical protein